MLRPETSVPVRPSALAHRPPARRGAAPRAASTARPRSALAVVALLAALIPSHTLAGDVALLRDERGVVHVFGASDRATLYGAGYACARDRLVQMHWTRRAAQGRLAELVGLQTGSVETTLAHDLRQRHTGLYRHALEVAPTLDARTRKLLEAYCAGVDAAVAEMGGVLPAPFAGQVFEPWTPADCLAVWDRLATLFQPFPADEVKARHDFDTALATLGDLEAAVAAVAPLSILDESAAVVLEQDVPPGVRAKIAQYAEQMVPPGPIAPATAEGPKFSQAWAVSRSRSASGKAVLVSDPQTRVSLPSLWYEQRLRGRSFDARGVGVAGCPGFLIGWTPRVAWGVTALGADQADLFRLDTSDVPPGSYRVDGQVVPFETATEALLVAGGPSQELLLRRSLFGPVVTELLPDALPGEEYALAAVPQGDPSGHTVESLLAMLRARGVKGLRKAAAGWRAPGVHLVAADRRGRILYQMLAGIPLRSGLTPLAGFVAQDGDTAAAAWLESVPYELLPSVRDPEAGVLFSANHLPVGDWYGIPLHIGTGGTGDNSRSWRLRELLVGAAGGPPAPELLAPEDVRAMRYDVVNPWRREIVRIGLAMQAAGAALSPTAQAALDILGPWREAGARSLVGEPGYAVAHQLGTGFRKEDAPELVPIYGGSSGGLSYFLKSLGARLDAGGEPRFAPAEVAWIDASLARGVLACAAFFGADPAGWDAGFAASNAAFALPYGASLEGFGSLAPSLDKSFGPLTLPDGGALSGQRSQSYTQCVDFADPDQSRALLPVGVSEDPASSHHTDQAAAWLALELQQAGLPSRKELQASAEEIVLLPWPQ